MGGMMLPITQNNKAPDSVPRKKSQEKSEGGVNMNAQEELKALKERIAELEEQVKEEQEFPKRGDEYWYTDEYGTVCSYQSDEFFNKVIIEDMKAVNNIFRTKEQAEFAVEKLKVEAELRKFGRPFESGENNYHISFETYDKFIDIDSLLYRQTQGVIYFGSREKAQQAIESVGEERIKKYIFEVED